MGDEVSAGKVGPMLATVRDAELGSGAELGADLGSGAELGAGPGSGVDKAAMGPMIGTKPTMKSFNSC